MVKLKILKLLEKATYGMHTSDIAKKLSIPEDFAEDILDQLAKDGLVSRIFMYGGIVWQYIRI